MNILEARRRLLGADVYKKTAEGNPISVRSLARMYPGIEMEGWTEQQSTTGAQLIDIDDNEPDPDSPTILRFKCHLVEGESYTITNNGNDNINFKISDRRDGYNSVGINRFTGSRTFTMFRNENIPESSEQFLYFWIYQGERVVEVNDISMIKDLNIMINSGSEALPWEPYTGNQPSPSPDYPQEIVNAGKFNDETQKWEYEVKLTGANLFDAKKYVELNSKYYEIGPNGGVIQTVADGRGTGSISVLHTLPPGTFYIRGDKSYGQVIIDGVTFIVSNPGSYAILTLEKETDIAYKFHMPSNNSYPSEEYFPMVSRVQDATYEPYRTPQTVLLQSDRPLTKWDRLEKRDGQWGWVYKSGAKQLISDMPIHKNLEGTYQVASFAEVDKNRLAESLSTHFIYKLSTTEYGNFWFDSVGAGLRFRMSQFQTAEEVKDWLQENEVYFAFPNAEETFVPLTESEQSALEALHTNYPTTVLFNDQGCNMKLTYKTKKSLEVT